MMFGRRQLRFIIQTYFSAARILRNRFADGKAGRTAKTVIGVKQRLRSPHNYAFLTTHSELLSRIEFPCAVVIDDFGFHCAHRKPNNGNTHIGVKVVVFFAVFGFELGRNLKVQLKIPVM